MIFEKTKWYARYHMVLFCASMLCTGWNDSLDSIRNESAKITSITATFTQTKRMKILKNPLVSKGSFSFKSPNSVRWYYDAPVKCVLLLHKGTSKRFTHSGSDWTEDAGISAEATSVMLNEIMLWSTGHFEDSRNFKAEITNNPRRIQLQPRESSLRQIISSIELIPNTDMPGMIQSIIIKEGEDNSTTFDFDDVKINLSLDDTLFRKP